MGLWRLSHEGVRIDTSRKYLSPSVRQWHGGRIREVLTKTPTTLSIPKERIKQCASDATGTEKKESQSRGMCGRMSRMASIDEPQGGGASPTLLALQDCQASRTSSVWSRLRPDGMRYRCEYVQQGGGLLSSDGAHDDRVEDVSARSIARTLLVMSGARWDGIR